MLKAFQIALQRADALPKEEQGKLATMRMRSMLQRKEADALSELGEYAQADALFTQVSVAQRDFSAADPQDLRARADLEVVLSDEAVAYQDAADPELFPAAKDRARNLAVSNELWTQVVAITEKMLQQDP